MTATYAYALALFLLLAILALAAYVDRIYFEMGKFLSREYQDNIDAWEKVVEPRLRLGRESIALSASVLRQLTLVTLALLSGLRLYTQSTLVPSLVRTPSTGEIVRAIPSPANCASFVACTLSNATFVATTQSVVFDFPPPMATPFSISCSASANSRDAAFFRAPATIFPFAGSRTSPSAFTAHNALTSTPPGSVTV